MISVRARAIVCSNLMDVVKLLDSSAMSFEAGSQDMAMNFMQGKLQLASDAVRNATMILKDDKPTLDHGLSCIERKARRISSTTHC